MTDYLIIGGTGSLGRRLIERLLPDRSLAIYSRDEAKHWTIRNEIACGPLAARLPALRFFVGDVRDAARVREVIRESAPETVIVAAALKQVDTCEISPFESVQTNLLGVKNVVDAVNDYEPPRGSIRPPCARLLLVGTDKNCSPVNVYGMSKAIAERIVTSRAFGGRHGVKYLAVRYGNVLESRGSIIPLFRHQADHAECLTVTDMDMTRFLMTLDQSVDLILRALEAGVSGETWIPRLPAMRIGDLAELFSKLSGKPIKVVGFRPGEKRHEDLVNESEAPRTRRVGDCYVIGPALAPGSGPAFSYTSADEVLTPEALAVLLERFISLPMDQFRGRTIEEIAK